MLVMHPGHLVSLLPLMLHLLLLQTASVLSSPATHVYPPNCAPPDSAVAPTPPPHIHPNNFYTGYLPIERCCPQVNECKINGGFCALDWLVGTVLPTCDHLVEDACPDYGCSCCIKCNQDKCSKCSETGGNCRKKCRSDETHDLFKKCTHKKCHCCKKCSMMDECREANGTCVSNHYDCPGGTHASSGCCGGCYCCKPEMQKKIECEEKGGHCSYTEECPTGYYSCFGECEATQFFNGLQQIIVGYCCAPKSAQLIPHGRIGALNYNMNRGARKLLSHDSLLGGEIQSEELNDLSPQLNDDGSAQDVVEDQIYDQVVPAEVVDDQIYDEVMPVEKKGDAVIDIDSHMDIPDASVAIDSPIYIPDADMAIDSPIDISDRVFYLPHQDDENNNGRRPHQDDEINDEVEKRKQHRRNHRKHTESKN